MMQQDGCSLDQLHTGIGAAYVTKVERRRWFEEMNGSEMKDAAASLRLDLNSAFNFLAIKHCRLQGKK